MKRLFFLLVLAPCFAFPQAKGGAALKKLEGCLDSNSVYLVCRGTRSKQGMVARDFNKADSLSTHVGIGMVKKGRLFICHVEDKEGDAFSEVPLSDYLREDCYYLALWRAPLAPAGVQRAKRLAAWYASRKILFDHRFRLSDDDTLYCSEFAYNFLQKLGFRMPKAIATKELRHPFYRAYLQRDRLLYLPVDFFQHRGPFRKVFECRL